MFKEEFLLIHPLSLHHCPLDKGNHIFFSNILKRNRRINIHSNIFHLGVEYIQITYGENLNKIKFLENNKNIINLLTI